MAFISMVFAGAVLVVIAIGFGLLFIGIILDIICAVRKHKQKKNPVILKVFAILLTILGIVQGIGPIVAMWVMFVISQNKYRNEIADIPEENLIHIDSIDECIDSFDFEGVHYVSNDDLHPQISKENFKTEKAGAFIADNESHYIIEKIINDQNFNIVQVERFSHVYVEQSKVQNVLDYYENESPLYCDINEYDTDKIKTVEKIDSDRIRKIRDYISENRISKFNTSDEGNDGYMIFYSFDDVYFIDFDYKETKEGLVLQYKGDSALITGEDAEYIKGLIE